MKRWKRKEGKERVYQWKRDEGLEDGGGLKGKGRSDQQISGCIFNITNSVLSFFQISFLGQFFFCLFFFCVSLKGMRFNSSVHIRDKRRPKRRLDGRRRIGGWKNQLEVRK